MQQIHSFLEVERKRGGGVVGSNKLFLFLSQCDVKLPPQRTKKYTCFSIRVRPVPSIYIRQEQTEAFSETMENQIFFFLPVNTVA